MWIAALWTPPATTVKEKVLQGHGLKHRSVGEQPVFRTVTISTGTHAWDLAVGG